MTAAKAVSSFVFNECDHIGQRIAQKETDFVRKAIAFGQARAQRIQRVLRLKADIALLLEEGCNIGIAQNAFKVRSAIEIA